MMFALVAASCGAPAEPRPPVVERVAGLWGGDLVFDVGPRGDLRVVPVAGGWRARLGSLDAPLTVDGDALTGDVGTGRLRLRRRGDALVGHWIQPRTAADPSYASPLAFARDADGGYRATVEPLGSGAHLYLAITDDGHAFLREPGHNLGRQLGKMTVTRDGDRLTLRDTDGKPQLHGQLAGGHLRLTLDRMKLSLDLTRRGRDDAPWFYPRASTDQTYHPAAPRDLGDGWRVGTLEAAGLADAPIRALVQSVIDAVPTAVTSPAIHGLVIARHGVLVVDEYFAGHRAETAHDTRSASKSLTTTLAGIAIDRGQLTLATPVYAAVQVAADDPRKQAITLEHLLTMSTGLACDDGDDASPGNEDRMQNESQDWIGATLALPVAHPAGAVGKYCSATINLIGAVLTAGSRAWLPERLRDDVLAPLDIAHYYMNLMPDGQGYLAGGLHLRTRDFAKLAQLFLDRGTWRGKQVVSAAWVAAATAAHAGLNRPDDYGFGWWRTTYHVDGTAYDAFYASGNGGQLAIAIPALELVVAFQAGNYNNFATWRAFVETLVPRYVIAATHRG